MMENNALIRYTGILEKAARLNQHVALIDRPRKTTLSRLLSLKLFSDYPNLMRSVLNLKAKNKFKFLFQNRIFENL